MQESQNDERRLPKTTIETPVHDGDVCPNLRTLLWKSRARSIYHVLNNVLPTYPYECTHTVRIFEPINDSRPQKVRCRSIHRKERIRLASYSMNCSSFELQNYVSV